MVSPMLCDVISTIAVHPRHLKLKNSEKDNQRNQKLLRHYQQKKNQFIFDIQKFENPATGVTTPVF